MKLFIIFGVAVYIILSIGWCKIVLILAKEILEKDEKIGILDVLLLPLRLIGIGLIAAFIDINKILKYFEE